MRNSRNGRQLVLNRGSPVRAYNNPLKSVLFWGVFSESHPKFVAFLNEHATTVNDNLLNITRRI